MLTTEVICFMPFVISDPPTCNNTTVNPVYALNSPSGNSTFTKSAKFKQEPCPLYEELDINLGMQAEYFILIEVPIFKIHYNSITSLSASF